MATTQSQAPAYRFDDRNIRWQKLGDFEHFAVCIFTVDEKLAILGTLRTSDFKAALDAQNQ